MCFLGAMSVLSWVQLELQKQVSYRPVNQILFYFNERAKTEYLKNSPTEKSKSGNETKKLQ